MPAGRSFGEQMPKAVEGVVGRVDRLRETKIGHVGAHQAGPQSPADQAAAEVRKRRPAAIEPRHAISALR